MHEPENADATRVFFSFFDDSLYGIRIVYDQAALDRVGGPDAILERLVEKFGKADPTSKGPNVEKPLFFALFWVFQEVDRSIEFEGFEADEKKYFRVTFHDTEGLRRFEEKKKRNANLGF